MYVTSRSNLLSACMKLYDCFMSDFEDEKYVESLSDLDIRAQLEVSFPFYFHRAIATIATKEMSLKRINISNISTGYLLFFGYLVFGSYIRSQWSS